MKKGIFVLVFLFLVGGVFAEISISDMGDVYSLGDRLYVSLDGVRGANSGNLNIDLVCDSKTTNLVKIPARAFDLGEDSSYSIPYKVLDREDLEVENLSDVLGGCQVVASLGASVVSSDAFVVSDDVVVRVMTDKVKYNPGETVSVGVSAVKANGVDLNGFVSASGVGGFDKVVEGGVANDSFVLGDTLEAGNYGLNVSVWDVSSSGVLNSGWAVYYFDVAQVPSSLVLSLGDLVATPGEEFDVGAEVYDQAGVEMSGVVVLRVVSEDGEGIEARLDAGEIGSIDFPSNSSAGSWSVEAQFGDLVKVAEFEMEELQRVEFDLSGSILSVGNIGNVLYNRTISVDVGGEVMTLDLNIDVGEVRKFNLDAPSGEYEVVVDDGETSFSKNTILTGNAVSIEDLANFSVFKDYSLIWIFLILVLILVVVLLFVRYKKGKVVGAKKGVVGAVKDKMVSKMPGKMKDHVEDSLNFTNKSPAVNGLDASHHVAEDKTMVDLTKKMGAHAESSLVLKGDKLMSSVVAISVKNYAELSDEGKVSLQKVVAGAKGKGLVDWRGDYVFVVFSPLVTRTYKNEALAVKCAMGVVEALVGHNKKFREKFEVGVGVHSGELVASKAGEKLKYTSIGNTISFAKRMSDSNKGRVVVSEDVRKKLMRDLKVSKGKDISEKATFLVETVRDGAGDQEKLKDLLKRSGK